MNRKPVVEVRGGSTVVPKVIMEEEEQGGSGIGTELYRLCTEVYLHVTFLCYMFYYYDSLTISIYLP